MHYFEWKLELVPNILWMIIEMYKCSCKKLFHQFFPKIIFEGFKQFASFS